MAMSDDEINALNESIREANEAMLTMVSTLAAVSNQSAAASTNMQNLNRNAGGASSSITTAGNAIDNFRNATNEAGKAEQKKKQVVLEVVNSLASLSGAVGGFGAALVSSDKSFSKYNSSISSATQGLGGLATVLIPFAGIGKILAVIINLFGMVAQGAAKLGDNLITATDELKSIGTAGAFTSEQFLKLAHDAGVTSANFGILVKPIKSMGSSILALGTDAGNSTIAFAKLAAVTDEERMRMRRLGVDQEELIQTQADFVKIQQMSGIQLSSRYKTEAQLQKASLDYVVSLKELSALTGEDVETIKQEQQAAAAQSEFQIKNLQLQKQEQDLRQSGNRIEADKIKGELAALNSTRDLAASFRDPKLMQGMTELLTTGGVAISETSGYLRNMIPEADSYFARIKEGDATAGEEMMEALKDNMLKLAEEGMGTAAIFDSDLRENVLFMSDQLLAKFIAMKDIDMSEVLRKATEDLANVAAAGNDSIVDGRAALTEAEIKAGVALDNVLFPATEGLATGFMKLNGLVNDLSENIDLILGYIPGYESRTELKGDVASEQQNIERYQQQLDAANDTLRNVTYSNRLEKFFVEGDRDQAERSIQNSLTRQSEQVIKLLNKGEDVDSNILNQAREEAERQLAESETRLSNKFVISDPAMLAAAEEGVRVNREELDMIMARVDATLVGPLESTFVGPPVALATSQSTTSPIRTPSQTIADITNTPVAGTAVTNTVDTTTAPTTANNTNTNTDIDTIMSMLSNKLDNVISLLETGVTIQDGLLIAARN